MTKEDFLQELKNPQTSTLEVLEKKYLFHIPLDEEVYQAIVEKLCLEANLAGMILEKAAKDLGNYSESEVLKAQEEFSKIRQVVFSTCLSKLQKEKYMAESTALIQKKTNSMIPHIQRNLNEGFSFAQDPFTSNFKVLNKFNQCVFETPYVSAKDILQTWGVDTSSKYFFLFYAALFPIKEIIEYRQAYTFGIFFNFQ
jgi:hypothetical protein